MKKGTLLAIAVLALLIPVAAVLALLTKFPMEKTYTPVSANGRLSVKGQRIVNEDGVPFAMKGLSTMSIGWQSDYVNKDAFRTARDKWGVNTIRLPIPTSGPYGYRRQENRASILDILDTGIELAQELGLYVIVDWHTLHEQDPRVYETYAIEVMDHVSRKYPEAKHILYEICNEPNGNVGWQSIKAYAGKLIPVIRANAPEAIIIVGTPSFSADLSGPVRDPLEGCENLMYAYHFYAGSAKAPQREKFRDWAETGLPILVTEFSVSQPDSDGTDAPALVSANHWMQLLDHYGIGRVYFSLSAEDQTNAMLQPGCDPAGGWTWDDLTPSGQWITGCYRDYVGSYADTLGTTEKTASAELPGVAAALALESYGREKDGYSSFYKVRLTNGGEASPEGWTLKITFEDTVGLKDSWNGTYKIEDRTMTVTPAPWNSRIPPGETIELGFIVTGTDLSCVLDMTLQAEENP